MSKGSTKILVLKPEMRTDEVFVREMLFSHSYLTSVFLPLRRPPDDVRTISRSSGSVSLQLIGGSLPDGNGNFIDVPIPYGSKARLVMINLCSRAVKQRSDTIQLESSFTAFARELGHSTCHRSMIQLREQMRRMSVLTMRLAKDGRGTTEVFTAPLFDSFKATYSKSPDQQLLFPDSVQFSPKFYSSLVKHAVPISKDALSSIQDSGLAIDILLWSSARLPRTLHKTKIKWSSIQWAFGNNTDNRDSFRRRWKIAFNRVKKDAYPEARMEIVRGGIVIEQSPPPIPFKHRREGLLVG